MEKKWPASDETVGELARRYRFSREAVTDMLQSVATGNGTMAQFHHPEFGGLGQWMRGGMTMVSGMSDSSLKARIDGLCSELARLAASDPGVTRAPPRDWWPADLGTPDSSGAQNDVRYAYFAQARRLAIEGNGRLTLYDTLDHQIGGFSQQQSRASTLSFHSQHGLVDVASLPVIP